MHSFGFMHGARAAVCAATLPVALFAGLPAQAAETVKIAFIEVKIAVARKEKSGEDFTYAAHWNTMNMLRAAMQKARSTDPKKLANALEGMKA